MARNEDLDAADNCLAQTPSDPGFIAAGQVYALIGIGRAIERLADLVEHMDIEVETVADVDDEPEPG